MNDDTIVLDTQLLILLTVGATSTDLIERHKNTRQFDVADFDLLQILLGARAVLLLPNVVTETSNLVRQHRPPERHDICRTLASLVYASLDRHVSSRLACEDRDYLRLGVTDAALMLSAADHHTLLSADLELCVRAEMRGIKTINFNHERERFGLV